MQSLAAIADPTRRRIVELLAERDRTAGELVAEFDMSAPAISQHLKVLRESGLITTRAEGQSRIQALNPDGFDDLEDWLQKTRSSWSRRLDALERELRAEDEANAKAAKKKENVMSEPVHAIVMHRFDASAERVFEAWFDPSWLRRWMFGPGVRDERVVRLSLDARVGGTFSFVVNRQGAEIDHVGEYLEIDRPRLLVFTWATRASLPETSRVIVEITPRESGGCDVKLTHVMGANWSAYVDKAADAWTQMLDTLGRAIAEDCASAGPELSS